jgi:hypothetical protein
MLLLLFSLILVRYNGIVELFEQENTVGAVDKLESDAERAEGILSVVVDFLERRPGDTLLQRSEPEE